MTSARRNSLAPDGAVSAPTTNVLVVDDDDRFRRTTARVLTEAGYETSQASSGLEARDLLSSDTEFGALLCDIRMPGESGLDLIAHLAADHPDLAVVMTTGVDDPQVAAAAFEIGADAYLIKPFTTNEIVIALSNSLRRRRLEIERRQQLHGLEHTVNQLRTLTYVLKGIESAPMSADEDLIDRLSMAISLRDEETGGHIERMSRYAAVLAGIVGYSGGSSEQVRLACALHDVGKIGVSDTILLKPGPLSPEEYAAMQRHAQMGYALLSGSSSEVLSLAAQVALGHHEWWDGSGYPRGLSADQIPEVARIAAVADVFDALTSNRVYRPAFPIDEAVAIMSELRGQQFEPRLLDAFIEMAGDLSAIRLAYPDLDDGGPRIRVLIVDDHEIFVQSLERLLGAEPTIKVVGAAGSVAEAVKAATAYLPDIVLMDFELPDGDGVSATEQIRALTPSAKVVMLSRRGDPGALARAIAAGCAGFVTKTEPAHTLVGAIRVAFEGEALWPAADLPQLLGRLSSTRRGLGADLGARELEVLGLVAAGFPNKAIAQRLHISLNTVRNHVQRILYKLDAHSRLEAVAIAVREGIIDREREALGG